MARLPVPDLGAYLREQRVAAHLSLRELADRAGMSNPYLSQIERGLRKPSAEILGALADALDLSAEALYVRAGILEPPARDETVVAAIHADPALSDRQKRTLVDLYRLFVHEADAATARVTPHPQPAPVDTGRPGRTDGTDGTGDTDSPAAPAAAPTGLATAASSDPPVAVEPAPSNVIPMAHRTIAHRPELDPSDPKETP